MNSYERKEQYAEACTLTIVLVRGALRRDPEYALTDTLRTNRPDTNPALRVIWDIEAALRTALRT